MGPFAAREVAAALIRKGFEKRENDHTFFHLKYRGKDVGISTKISHGEREIRIGLVKRMRGQMMLATNADFGRFVECSLTYEAYIEMLKTQGIIQADPA